MSLKPLVLAFLVIYASASAPQSSTSTPSSTSSTDEEDQWEEEQNFDQLLQSIEITHPQEDKRGQEQEVDRLLGSLGTAHLTSTRSQIQDTENDDSGGVPINRSELGHKELVLTLDNFDNDVITEKITVYSCILFFSYV
ncbi:hypothetical protein QYE76_042801 [Lolium multiflorum]|uniref:Uncharacterized protein n=1 Tax=Lolium multiflorum TaxID=4521 RepID=A0AAD8THU4_LOLMU|nr:hypothetical protein QYE76_042801 [Lolium multiflorum]